MLDALNLETLADDIKKLSPPFVSWSLLYGRPELGSQISEHLVCFLGKFIIDTACPGVASFAEPQLLACIVLALLAKSSQIKHVLVTLSPKQIGRFPALGAYMPVYCIPDGPTEAD